MNYAQVASGTRGLPHGFCLTCFGFVFVYLAGLLIWSSQYLNAARLKRTPKAAGDKSPIGWKILPYSVLNNVWLVDLGPTTT